MQASTPNSGLDDERHLSKMLVFPHRVGFHVEKIDGCEIGVIGFGPEAEPFG